MLILLRLNGGVIECTGFATFATYIALVLRCEGHDGAVINLQITDQTGMKGF